MLQMLREKLLQLLELVQARGVGGGVCVFKLTALCPCLHSITLRHPCILWDPQGCCHTPPALSSAQHHSCRGISLHQSPRTLHCSAPMQPSLSRGLHWVKVQKEGNYWDCSPLQILAFPTAAEQKDTYPGGHRRGDRMLHVYLVPCKIWTHFSGLTALTQWLLCPGNASSHLFTHTLFIGSPWHVVVLLFTVFQWVLVT